MVKFNNLFLLLSAMTSWKLIAAADKCEELDDFVDQYYDENNEFLLLNCELDENNDDIESVKLGGGVIIQDVIDKLSTYPGLKYLEFSRFDEYPEDINFESLHLSQLKFYDLKYGRKITKFRYHQIPDSVIRTMKNVENIDFVGYNITQGTIDAIGSTNIKEVYLTESAFDKNLDYSSLKNLRSLYLDSYFGSASVDKFSESFCKMENLELLYLPGGNIRTIPKCIKNLKKLQDLDLSANELKSIPKELSELTQLKFLDISINEYLTSLPKGLEKLINLEYLNLKEDNIKKSPTFICGMNKLKTLNLSSNSIKEIPSCIGNLSELRDLDISSNDIATFPNGILELKNLETLNMSYNQIEEVTDSFEKLNKLVDLDLRDNLITKFPESIGQLSNLSDLKLDYNQIDDVIPESYNNIESLSYVSFQNNVHIRGKSLTNPNLFLCYYLNSRQEVDDFCLDPNAKCIPYGDNYKSC